MYAFPNEYNNMEIEIYKSALQEQKAVLDTYLKSKSESMTIDSNENNSNECDSNKNNSNKNNTSENNSSENNSSEKHKSLDKKEKHIRKMIKSHEKNLMRVQTTPSVTKECQLQYFSNMFLYGKDTACGSGHDSPVRVEGWLRHFYMKYNEYTFVNRFPGHIGCVPFLERNENTPSQPHIIVSGLTAGTFDDDNNIVPHYEIIHAKIVGENKDKICKLLNMAE